MTASAWFTRLILAIFTLSITTTTVLAVTIKDVESQLPTVVPGGAQKVTAAEIVQQQLALQAQRDARAGQSVSFTIGSNNTNEQDRLIFHAHPNLPFVWTNFRDGTFALTRLDKHLFTFGRTSIVDFTPTVNSPAFSVLRFKEYRPPTPRLQRSILYTQPESSKRMRGRNKFVREELNAAASTTEFEPTMADLPSSRHIDELPDGDLILSLVEVEESAVAPSNNNGTTVTSTNASAPTTTQPTNQPFYHTFAYATDFSAPQAVLSVSGHIAAIGEIPQWSLLHLDDFQYDADGWSAQDRNLCGDFGDVLLGGYCKFADIQATKTFQIPHKHSFVRIKARYHFIDAWKGQYGFAKVGNTAVWTQKHHYCPKIFGSFCRGINICGDDAYPDTLSVPIDVVLPHTVSNITLTFGSSLEPTPCRASWAVDDVSIYIM